MTKVIIQTDDEWTKRKIISAIHTEIELLKKAIEQVTERVQDFENKYGKLSRNSLFGKIDDMELLEWEGEIEVLKRMKKKLKSLEDIIFEYQRLRKRA